MISPRLLKKLQKNTEVMEASDHAPHLPGLHIDKLTIRYDNHVAIEQAQLNAKPGEVLALVGPSGCGKSSLLSAINRMTDLLPNCRVEGAIWLDQKNVLAPDCNVHQLRRRIGMVFQQANPFPMSIRDNIHFPLKEHGVTGKKQREQRMQEVLEATGLWHEVKHRLNSSALRLSGGQQQRLCFARALSLKPKLLLLDEPCSALDPISTQSIEQLIKNLKGEVTTLIVTHNLGQARRIADQVAVCWVNSGCGCVVECDTTQNIFLSPKHPVTKAYCGGEVG